MNIKADIHGVYCTLGGGGGFGSRNLRIAHFTQHHVDQVVQILHHLN